MCGNPTTRGLLLNLVRGGSASLVMDWWLFYHLDLWHPLSTTPACRLNRRCVRSSMKAHLGSSSAFSTTRMVGQEGSRVQAQKELRLSVSLAGSPCLDLNHCLSESTKETRQIGTEKIMVQSFVMSSNRFSGSCITMIHHQSSQHPMCASCDQRELTVLRIERSDKVAIRPSSFSGFLDPIYSFV